MDAGDLLAARLASHRIHPPGGARAGRDIAATARHLLAMQAQDFAQAIWGLGLRSPGSTRADVAEALESGTVLRSWTMRGTLHFVSSDDLRWMLEITGPRMIAQFDTRRRELGLDQHTIDRARDVALDVLSGGRRLGRAEFQRELEAAGVSTTGQRGYHLIFALAVAGVVVWGPPLAGQQALVLLDEWAPDSGERRPRLEAIGEFLLRYLAGHGPATIRDFAWWTKVTLTDARAALAAVRDRLTELRLDDQTYFVLRTDHTESPPPSPGAVHALPGFDEFLLGYQDRSLQLPHHLSQRVVPGKNGIFLPTIVVDGRVAGTWRRSTGPDAMTVTVQPFAALSEADEAGLGRALARYGDFVGLPIVVSRATGA